ncbi:MAG TPA: flagellar FliJ family protein [Acidimicrobiales bacterium]|nr:flagellar FliJ family protein [Acidimicrobiales bacterium]
MSSRRFRLATVLRVRRAQEESARAELLLGNLRMRDNDARRERSALRYRTVPVSTGTIPAAVFRREQATADLAAATLRAAEDRLSQSRAEVAGLTRSWADAAQRVEALERLARRRLGEVMAGEARAESAAVDDLVTARWIAAGDRGGPNRAVGR